MVLITVFLPYGLHMLQYSLKFIKCMVPFNVHVICPIYIVSFNNVGLKVTTDRLITSIMNGCLDDNAMAV